MGLMLLMSDISPFFGIGVTLASFQLSGILHLLRDRLKMNLICSGRADKPSFNSLELMSRIPDDLYSLMLLIKFITFSMVTG